MRILITGATGNVGSKVLARVNQSDTEIFAGVRNPNSDSKKVSEYCDQVCQIDFEKKIYPSQTFDAIFLVRPPQLTDPDLFREFLNKHPKTTHIVFLSVQGAGERSYLPHAKIEKVISELEFEHTFIRPSYFMENLTTTLWDELERNQRIYLPAGDTTFTWTAISDIADIASETLLGHIKKSIITVGSEQFTFEETVGKINRLCGVNFSYKSPNVISYMFYSIWQGKSFSYLLVMLLLHFVPRFTADNSAIDDDYEQITGQKPTSLDEFIKNHCDQFQQLSQ